MYKGKKGNKTMPYIDVKTTVTLTKEKIDLLKTKIAEILASSFPGKTENWLMLNFAGGCSMYFAGSDADCMLVDIAIFGSQADSSYDKMTAAVCELIEKECGIAQNRVYVKYSEYSHWGWNGMNF